MFEYTPAALSNSVFVIGAGGTGGRLIPLLSQFLKTLDWIRDPTIYLVDHDTVEERNLKRQNFVHVDVNRHKAVVLAERYEGAYGTRIIPIVEKITEENALTFWATKAPETNTIQSSPLIIMCVDSAGARRNIIRSFARFNQRGGALPLYIDSGNEDSFGQVQFFHPTPIWDTLIKTNVPDIISRIPEMIPVSKKIQFSPMDVNFYKNLVDTPSRASCADLDQTLAINAMMATSIMGIVQNYYYSKPFRFNRINVCLSSGSILENNSIRNLATKVIDWDDQSTQNFCREHGITPTTPGRFSIMADQLFKEVNLFMKGKGINQAPAKKKSPERVITPEERVVQF